MSELEFTLALQFWRFSHKEPRSSRADWANKGFVAEHWDSFSIGSCGLTQCRLSRPDTGNHMQISLLRVWYHKECCSLANHQHLNVHVGCVLLFLPFSSGFSKPVLCVIFVEFWALVFLLCVCYASNCLDTQKFLTIFSLLVSSIRELPDRFCVTEGPMHDS